MVMPLYDDDPFKLPHRPVVTWSLIAINLIVFMIEYGTESGPELMAYHYGLTPAVLVGDGVIPGALPAPLTLITYMFLHADLGHIFGNMLFLWVFGDNVEEAMGRLRFIAFYLLSGMAGGLAFVLSDPHSQTPLIGASGAIAGIVIGYVMLRPCAKITVLVSIIPLRLSAYWVVGAFVIMQIVNLSAASKSGIAYWAHLGGMTAGAFLFAVMRPPGVKLFECIRASSAPVAAGGKNAVGGARGFWDAD